VNLEMQEWLNLAVRWFHVITGVMWIGQTYLFNWMERAFEPPKDAGKKNISGELWMVHGGGFYLVEKQKWPEIMPRVLHWFKYEALFTWISGFLLLMIVYWAGAPLLPYGSELPLWQGVALSTGTLVAAVAVYRAIWFTPLGDNLPAGVTLSWLLIVGSAWGLGKVFSDRSAFLHIGAMFGTIMVTNVWMTILPNQRKMMAITEAGGKPEPRLAVIAGRCSKHNTYMSVPLIFTMISNHFPATFASAHAPLMMGVLVLLGWAAAKLIRDVL
jgi:uncharacterized membrane protein